MKFSEQLSHLMRSNGTSISELARYVGVSRQAVMRWLEGSMPSADKAALVAQYYNTSFDELSPNNDYRVPIVGSIRAGYPIESFEDNQGYVNSDYMNHGNLFALKVVGDSMMPVVMEGDIIICDRNVDKANDRICAVTVGSESTLKRVRIDSAGITLIPTNPLYKEIRYTKKIAEEMNIHIDGVLIQMIRNF